MPADILLYAVIAAGLVIWLRNLLGTRHDDEPQRPNPFITPPGGQNTSGTPPQRTGTSQAGAPGAAAFSASTGQPEADHLQAMINSLGRTMGVEGEVARQGLLDIVRTDRQFDLGFFLNGAQDAFVMIVESFASGDKDTIQPLLAAPLYEAFEKVINERAEKNQSASVEIHSVRRADIIEAVLRDDIAFITVKFTADETNLLYDKDDKVISGHPDHVTETIDIWTFGRNIRSRDPAWLLYETREAEEKE